MKNMITTNSGLKEISQKQLISQSIVAKWEEFAIELDFDDGQISRINKMASQRDVEECSLIMLQRWWNAHSNPNVAELITALRSKGIQQNNYAQQLENG